MKAKVLEFIKKWEDNIQFIYDRIELQNRGEAPYGLKYNLVDIQLEQNKINSALTLNGYVCTDIDTNQFRLNISENVFIFREDRVSDPETGRKEVFEGSVDLREYTEQEIQDCLDPFGYELSDIKEDKELIAECIFEMV